MDKAKTHLQFLDANCSGTTISTKSFGNKISILTTEDYYDEEIDKKEVIINLDIPTAIKLYKTLRHEINKAKEVQNG